MDKDDLTKLVLDCALGQVFRKTDLNGKPYCTLFFPEEPRYLCDHCGMTEQYLVQKGKEKVNIYYCACRRVIQPKHWGDD